MVNKSRIIQDLVKTLYCLSIYGGVNYDCRGTPFATIISRLRLEFGPRRTEVSGTVTDGTLDF